MIQLVYMVSQAMCEGRRGNQDITEHIMFSLGAMYEGRRGNQDRINSLEAENKKLIHTLLMRDARVKLQGCALIASPYPNPTLTLPYPYPNNNHHHNHNPYPDPNYQTERSCITGFRVQLP